MKYNLTLLFSTQYLCAPAQWWIWLLIELYIIKDNTEEIHKMMRQPGTYIFFKYKQIYFMTFTQASTRQKHHVQSRNIVRWVQYTFSIHSSYLLTTHEATKGREINKQGCVNENWYSVLAINQNPLSVTHRYTPEIPEPAPSWSRHGARFGGLRVFPVTKIIMVRQVRLVICM